MKQDDIDRSIIKALQHPEDDSRIAVLVEFGQQAYDRIVSRLYPCPSVTHTQESDDRMSDLTVRIARIDPTIVTENINHKDSLARSRVVGAAMATGMQEFAGLIVERLADRSIYVLDKAVWAVERNEYIQTQRAADLLRKLLKKEVSNRLYTSRNHIEALANDIENRQAEQVHSPDA